MKKFLILIVLVLGSFNLYAQSDIKIGGIIEGGIANIYADAGGSISGMSKIGSFAIGGVAQIPLSSNIYLNTELRYSTKGAENNIIQDVLLSKLTIVT